MKIMLISFFISNNIGDLLISDTLKKKMEADGHQVVMYDFLEVKKIVDIKTNIDYTGSMVCESAIKKVAKKLLGKKGQCLKYKCESKWKQRFQQFEKDLQGCDEVYFGGGNMIMDITPIWPLILQDYILAINSYKIPYSFVAVGVGPILNNMSKKIFKPLLQKAKKLSVRGAESGKVLESLGIDSYEVTIDPVLTLDLKKEEVRRQKIENYLKERKIDIGIGVLGKTCFLSEKKYYNYIADIQKVIENLSNNSLIHKIVLFTTETMDYETINMIRNENVSEVVCGDSVQTVIDLYDRLDYIISGRMHSLILAQRCMVPFLGICWQEKVKEFCNQVDSLQDLVSLNELRNVDSNTLRIDEKISYAWLERQKEKNNILQKVKQF